MQLASLARTIGYEFRDESILVEALTHPSADAQTNLERLEFLGDRVLGLVIAAWLFERFGDADEGEMATRLNFLVRKERLTEVAERISLGDYVHLGKSEIEAGGNQKPGILADACEALLGAVYLDGGYDAAENFVLNNWHDALLASATVARDPKTELQEWAQARSLGTPDYLIVNRTGPDHAPVFTVEVTINDSTGRGIGASRRAAESKAAKELLESLKDPLAADQ